MSRRGRVPWLSRRLSGPTRPNEPHTRSTVVLLVLRRHLERIKRAWRCFDWVDGRRSHNHGAWREVHHLNLATKVMLSSASGHKNGVLTSFVVYPPPLPARPALPTCSAFAQMSQYFDDQLTIQQQAADQLRKQYNKDVQSFREAEQVGQRGGARSRAEQG